MHLNVFSSKRIYSRYTNPNFVEMLHQDPVFFGGAWLSLVTRSDPEVAASLGVISAGHRAGGSTNPGEDTTYAAVPEAPWYSWSCQTTKKSEGKGVGRWQGDVHP